ncbi:hypothetical protein LTR78_000079 [Recurvomyces mirabilis]|uniref:Uncharacterized protein n=1 Tax=Recurvomyces mirabilis TaxID=574656 RepID=A0AAE0WXD4_9PEZI|nr:hypothetical protein LTR78_000079 [Recurvomyces mirabilis]KAK5161735.1 hypothetical protein LTS14_000080 [Recurvomyces mirabilis]
MVGFALLYHDEMGDEQNLIALCESGEVDPKALISADDLNDKSKSDVVGKSLAAFQIGYFLVVVLERVAAGLTISQLELGVCGFVVCSIAIYAAWFHKPKSVQTVMVLKRYDDRIPGEVMKVIEDTSHAPDDWSGTRVSPGTRIRNHADHIDSAAGSIHPLSLAAIALRGVHLAGWRFSFPSVIDQWIWRGTSITSTAAVPLALTASYFFHRGKYPTLHVISDVIILVFGIMYVLSRLALMVEMFRGLFYLPPDAFKATSWATSIPHIG